MCLNIRVDNSEAPLKNFSFTPARCADVSGYAANLLNAAAEDADARMLQPFAPSGCPNPLTLRVRCPLVLGCPAPALRTAGCLCQASVCLWGLWSGT